MRFVSFELKELFAFLTYFCKILARVKYCMALYWIQRRKSGMHEVWHGSVQSLKKFVVFNDIFSVDFITY